MSSSRMNRWLVDWRRLVALPAADRRRLLRAAWRLLAIDLRLRLRGFAKVADSLERRMIQTDRFEPGAVDAWTRAVDVAARHHLYPMPCVPRSLALRSLLAEAGVRTELRIGVRKMGESLAAHAWVEHRGVPLGESPAITERFTPLEPVGADGRHATLFARIGGNFADFRDQPGINQRSPVEDRRSIRG